jgi:hypothetical protein
VFADELNPIIQELAHQPIAFLGGFFSGLFRLNLADDPVKGWLDQQTGASTSTAPNETNNGKSSGPKSISID